MAMAVTGMITITPDITDGMIIMDKGTIIIMGGITGAITIMALKRNAGMTGTTTATDTRINHGTAPIGITISIDRAPLAL